MYVHECVYVCVCALNDYVENCKSTAFFLHMQMEAPQCTMLYIYVCTMHMLNECINQMERAMSVCQFI